MRLCLNNLVLIRDYNAYYEPFFRNQSFIHDLIYTDAIFIVTLLQRNIFLHHKTSLLIKCLRLIQHKNGIEFSIISNQVIF